jgi:hypothetical protein
VLQGGADVAVPEFSTAATVERTCAAVPSSKIQYTALESVSHIGVLYAGQQVWLDWIADRFKHIEVPEGCARETLESQQDASAYETDLSFTLQYAIFPYETA